MNSQDKINCILEQGRRCKENMVFPGPTGPTGPIGPTGLTGATGPAGISETITVGNTTTGEPGTEASVIDRTGGPNHVLDFTIPQGPTGPGSETTLAYGGIYNPSVQLVFFTALNNYVQVNLRNALPSLNVTPSVNTLTINEPGDYEISYNILMSTSRPVDIGIAVRKNGTVITETRGTQTLALDSTTTISYDGRLAANTIVTLATGDILDLAVQVINTLPANLDAIINNNANATLTVKKIN